MVEEFRLISQRHPGRRSHLCRVSHKMSCVYDALSLCWFISTYEDTYKSGDFDLRQHFCASYLVVSYNGQNEVCFSLHSIQIWDHNADLGIGLLQLWRSFMVIGWFVILSMEVAVWDKSVSFRFWHHVKFHFFTTVCGMDFHVLSAWFGELSCSVSLIWC